MARRSCMYISLRFSVQLSVCADGNLSMTKGERYYRASYKGLSKIKLAILCYTPGTLMLEVCRWN
jgi:hypothetical protein